MTTDTAWTDLPGVWTNLQIATALMNAIWPDDGDEDKPLKHAIVDAERVCRQMRDEMAARLKAAQERIAELEAPLPPIYALAAAMEPDWSSAPAWAVWWAVDKDGGKFWYERQPELHLTDEMWKTPYGRHLGDRLAEWEPIDYADWQSSLRHRQPQQASGEDVV